MKYKITKYQDSEDFTIVYTLCEFDEEEDGEKIKMETLNYGKSYKNGNQKGVK